ncbi:MAG: YciI family protein [Rhodospirillales bacterium]
MIFTILCLDKPDALPRRLAAIEAHRAYLLNHKHPVDALISGPLVQESDGETMKGSFFLAEAPSRAAIEAWQADDPLASADVWESVIIEAFNKRVDKLSGSGA